jgi:hypothetical protein
MLFYARWRFFGAEGGNLVKSSDRIRLHGREHYVLSARHRGDKRFSIRVADVARKLRINGRFPVVCSALRTKKFLNENHLRLVETIAPKSGQSSTVVYTYEFVDTKSPSKEEKDPWMALRGSLKEIFADFGGGESYLRAERESFYPSEDAK